MDLSGDERIHPCEESGDLYPNLVQREVDVGRFGRLSCPRVVHDGPRCDDGVAVNAITVGGEVTSVGSRNRRVTGSKR